MGENEKVSGYGEIMMNIRERLQITLDGGLDQWPIASIEWEYREAIKALDAAQARETELLADNERLRDLLSAWVRTYPECAGEDDREALSATPAQSLARHNNSIRRECATAGGPEDSYQDEWFKAKADSAARILATKEPE